MIYPDSLASFFAPVSLIFGLKLDTFFYIFVQNRKLGGFLLRTNSITQGIVQIDLHFEVAFLSSKEISGKSRCGTLLEERQWLSFQHEYCVCLALRKYTLAALHTNNQIKQFSSFFTIH